MNPSRPSRFPGLASTLAILSILPFLVIGIFCTYQGVVNIMQALSDKPIRYPLSIPFAR